MLLNLERCFYVLLVVDIIVNLVDDSSRGCSVSDRLSMFRPHRWDPLCGISLSVNAIYLTSQCRCSSAVFKASFVLHKKHNRCKTRREAVSSPNMRGVDGIQVSQSVSQSNMRTHNEGGVVTGIEATLMQIDPRRLKSQSLLIKLFTTAWMLCIRDTRTKIQHCNTTWEFSAECDGKRNHRTVWETFAAWDVTSSSSFVTFVAAPKT